MPNRKALYLILLALTIIVSILAGIIYYSQKQNLKVVFLDVGQGDAILILQGSKQILIDGGPDGQRVLEKLGEHIPFWDRNIEIVIATHPDQDHIDGLVDVMKTYKVNEIMDNSETTDSQIYKKYLETIQEKNIPRLLGKAGMDIELDDGAQLNIVSPGDQLDNNSKDTNLDSIVTKLTYGGSSFLFTGDLPTVKEDELIKNNVDLSARILKVAHHGSKYATSDAFLDIVRPQEAVISVGKNNRYGHPAQEILERLKSKNIRISRTDEVGDVSYDCVREDCFLAN
jgi:competence protein ComEC